MAADNATLLAKPVVSGTSPGGWTALVDSATLARFRPRSPSVRRVVGRFVVANLVAVVVLVFGSAWASRTAAENHAIGDARRTTDLLAALVVEPALDDRLAAGDRQSVRRMDDVLRDRLAAAGVRRVKIWTREGRIVYSDVRTLIDKRYDLEDDELAALSDGVTRAELSDLSRPENQFERSEGRLLEVYGRIRTPGGRSLLLETYSPYEDATSREMDLWLKFAPISVLVLLALLAVQLPLASRMVIRLRATGRERELLQARALDASTEERRRIAGGLHDGIVQDVSASSLLVAGVADRLRDRSDSSRAEDVAEDLDQAASALRDSAGSLRSLLVEIYPPNLERAGLAPALADLATRLRPRGIDVRTRVPDGLRLPLETATLLFRTAQEALLNVAKHARASRVDVTLTEASGAVLMEIADDGVGFDLASALGSPRDGHLGLSVLADLAAAQGAALDMSTAPGTGTRLRLRVSRP